NKFIFSGVPPANYNGENEQGKLFNYLEHNDFMIMESVMRRDFLAPDWTQEHVLAQKVSGFQNPNFTLLTSMMQTTSIYKPFLNVMTTDFVNHISENSWQKYFF